VGVYVGVGLISNPRATSPTHNKPLMKFAQTALVLSSARASRSIFNSRSRFASVAAASGQGPGIDPGSLAMLTGREYIEFDYQNPHNALQRFLQSLYRQSLARQQQQTTLLLSFAALLLIALLKE
jgi:hypothetical protein